MNCTLGFFLSSSGSCANCPSNCWNCASADTCLACQTNYSISNGQCTESVDTTAKILIITLSAMFGCLIIMVILMIIGRKCNQSSRDREDGTDDNKINSQKQLNDENEPYNGKWISSQVNLGIIDNSRVCVICLEGGMNTLTECKHQFHNHCLGDWFKRNRNCPVCKSQNTKSLTIFCSRCRQYYLRYKVTKDYYGFMKTKFICNICLEMEPNSKMIQ